MIYNTVFLLKARQELLQAWLWYEERQSGLGDKFKNAIYDRINQIEQTPERFVQHKRPYREAKAGVFPYLIIYRINKKERLIVVASIFHTSRKQSKKYK